MGLDLYSGSLSKFYARDYETPQARFARQTGLTQYTLYADSSPPRKSEDVKPFILQFHKDLSEFFNRQNAEFTPWDEDKDIYLTEQLHHECFLALQVMCLSVYRGEDYTGAYDDSDALTAFLKMRSREEYFESGHAVLECQLFVTGTDTQCVPADDGVGGRVIMTTTSNLRLVLDQMNARVWSNKAKPEKWFERGPVTASSVEIKRGFFPWKKVESKPPANPVLWNAEYAFGVFSKLLDFSEKNHLPIRQDQ